MRYADITRARLIRQRNSTRLAVRASDGTRFGINPGTFDVSPLLKALYEQGWDLSSRSRAVDNSG